MITIGNKNNSQVNYDGTKITDCTTIVGDMFTQKLVQQCSTLYQRSGLRYWEWCNALT